MFVRAPKDFWSGLMFLAFAAVTLVAANGYSMGRGGRMGPGYFPTVLGAVLGGARTHPSDPLVRDRRRSDRSASSFGR